MLNCKWMSSAYGLLLLMLGREGFAAGGGSNPVDIPIPRDLGSYDDGGLSIVETLAHRVSEDPFNLVALIIFACAILHTFVASKFLKIAHDIQHRHTQKLIANKTIGKEHHDVSFLGQVFHFLGEVEAIFGIWVLALIAAITVFFDWKTATYYISTKVNYTEPMFVVVIMTLASTRPILNFSENMLKKISMLGKSTPGAWWWTLLTITPILGSFITEPAAMTIAALLLGQKFYALKPNAVFQYATLGLLFVNISVGGTLTNFAAPPVLMVAAPWDWSTGFMLSNFGWKAAVGIVVSNAIYYFAFQKEFKRLHEYQNSHKKGEVEITSDDQTDLVPFWVIAVHIFFMVWTVINAHYPPMFIGGFLFFLGFFMATEQHQNKLQIKSALLVGFFLGGLVTHGGLQGWWIAPVLGSFTEVPLMLAATGLTALNDNAAITYLSTLVPNFSDGLKYAVLAGAVTGGGLTVIANAPNPAGQAILSKYFRNKSISPLHLLLGAIVPTIVMGLAFMLL